MNSILNTTIIPFSLALVLIVSSLFVSRVVPAETIPFKDLVGVWTMSQGGPNHGLTREQVEELCGMAVLLFYPDRNLGIHMRWHKEDGYGEKTWPDGDIYKGEFKKGESNREGTYKWIDGKIYRGSFLKGDMHGKGTYTFTDGRRWVGEFRNEKIWNAKLYNKDGNVIREIVNGK